MDKYPSPDTWEYANSRQRERAARSLAELKRRRVPVFQGPLFVEDDEKVTTQTPQDVARRALVLWSVAIRGDGAARDEARAIVENLGLWDDVSPYERKFLNHENPSARRCWEMVWRLEALWVLMWALGHIENLEWPVDMCDVPRLTDLLARCESDPSFTSDASLRPTQDLVDAQDLLMRINWAIRDARLRPGGRTPTWLKWSGKTSHVHDSLSLLGGVIEERHHSVN